MDDWREPRSIVETDRKMQIAAALLVAVGFGTIGTFAFYGGSGSPRHVAAEAVAPANSAPQLNASPATGGSTAPASDSVPASTGTVTPSPGPEVLEATAAEHVTVTAPAVSETVAKPVKVARVQRKARYESRPVAAPIADPPVSSEESRPATPEAAPQETTAAPAEPVQEKVSADPPQENSSAPEPQASPAAPESTPVETAPQ